MASPIAVFWLSLMVVVGNLEREQLARTVLKASALQVGQTEVELSNQLGRPLGAYNAYEGWSILAIGKHPRQWCYGTRINLDRVFVFDPIFSINALPINIRWFGYCEDDLVVDFDEAGRVTRIGIPELRYEVDDRYNGILETIYALNALKEAIPKHSK